MKALYVGENNSMGFENGVEYQISSKIMTGSMKFIPKTNKLAPIGPVIWIFAISPENKKLKCPYASLEAFSKNWIITERI